MRGSFPDTYFTPDSLPDWHCPGCLNASLELVPGSFLARSDAHSLKYGSKPWFDTLHESRVFTCLLQCRRSSCRESVAVSGIGRGEEEYDFEQERLNGYVLYQAKFFEPPLPVFRIPEGCPEEIEEGLVSVSRLLPVSGSAAINAMRSVLEKLLDVLDVPVEVPRKNKDPERLSLHQRIVSYPALLGDHQEYFMALKWLGNAGSHGKQRLKNSDIKTGCEVLDDLLQRIYPRQSDVKEKIARLNDAFAPKEAGK